MPRIRPLPFAPSRAWLAIPIASAAILALLAASPAAEHFLAIDFVSWGADPLRLAACIANGTQSCGELSKFPLAYLGNAWLVQLLGRHGIEPATGLGLLNATFLVLPVALLLLSRFDGRALAASALYFALLWATPLPRFYVHSGALEVQQGVVLGILVACSVRALQRAAPAGWAATLATNLLVAVVLLYKDTTLPLLSLALLALLAHPDARSHLTRGMLSAAARLWAPGTLLATAGQAGYNWLRYGTVLPSTYLFEASETSPTLAHRLEQCFWLVASPNGGLLVFWGLAGILLAASCALLRLRPARGSLAYSLALVATSLVLLPNWWAAFGWDAWGARMLIPFGVSLLTSTCLSLEDAAPAALAQPRGSDSGIRRAWLVAPVLVAVAVASIRYVGIGYRLAPGAVLERSLFSQPACHEMLTALQAPPQGYEGLRFWRSDSYWACARARFSTDAAALSDVR